MSSQFQVIAGPAIVIHKKYEAQVREIIKNDELAIWSKEELANADSNYIYLTANSTKIGQTFGRDYSNHPIFPQHDELTQNEITAFRVVYKPILEKFRAKFAWEWDLEWIILGVYF